MQFRCRLCAGVNFKQVVVTKGDGYYKTAFYTCCGCGVMFVDHEKFGDPNGHRTRQQRQEPPKT
jgi:hypothetical protein